VAAFEAHFTALPALVGDGRQNLCEMKDWGNHCCGSTTQSSPAATCARQPGVKGGPHVIGSIHISPRSQQQPHHLTVRMSSCYRQGSHAILQQQQQWVGGVKGGAVKQRAHHLPVRVSILVASRLSPGKHSEGSDCTFPCTFWVGKLSTPAWVVSKQDD
jgi:hypothetical protein